jgi:nematocidal protein AidA
MSEFASSSQDVNVLVVIDTEYIKKNYPNPSKNANYPTGINHNSQFMLITGARKIISGQGTADLHFQANPGDDVSFTGISIYGNSDDAVIVYGIRPANPQGLNVFNRFVPNLVTRNRAVMPDPQTTNGLPPLHQKITFAGYEAKVAQSGREDFLVDIALYTLANDGNTQELFGYFYWDPTITVPG